MKSTLRSLLTGALCTVGMFGAVAEDAVKPSVEVPVQLPAPAPAVEGTVSANLLNVRLKPELDALAVTKLRNGEKVRVYREVGGFYEIAAPAQTPVYVSAIYVRDGKVLSSVHMRVAMSQNAKSYGMLKTGAAVTVEKISLHDWAKIAPPAELRLYAAKSYIKTAVPLPAQAAADVKETPAEKAQPVPAVKPEAVISAPAAKPATVPEAAPVPAVKPEAVIAPPAAKPEAAPENVAPSKLDHQLKALGVDLKAGQTVTVSGYVVALAESTTEAVKFALMKDEKGKYVTAYFVCADDVKALQGLAEKNVELTGTVCKVPNWKTPILKVSHAKILK